MLLVCSKIQMLYSSLMEMRCLVWSIYFVINVHIGLILFMRSTICFLLGALCVGLCEQHHNLF